MLKYFQLCFTAKKHLHHRVPRLDAQEPVQTPLPIPTSSAIGAPGSPRGDLDKCPRPVTGPDRGHGRQEPRAQHWASAPGLWNSNLGAARLGRGRPPRLPRGLTCVRGRALGLRVAAVQGGRPAVAAPGGGGLGASARHGGCGGEGGRRVRRPGTQGSRPSAPSAPRCTVLPPRGALPDSPASRRLTAAAPAPPLPSGARGRTGSAGLTAAPGEGRALGRGAARLAPGCGRRAGLPPVTPPRTHHTHTLRSYRCLGSGSFTRKWRLKYKLERKFVTNARSGFWEPPI